MVKATVMDSNHRQPLQRWVNFPPEAITEHPYHLERNQTLVSRNTLLPLPRRLCNARHCLFVHLSLSNFTKKLLNGSSWKFYDRCILLQLRHIQGDTLSTKPTGKSAVYKVSVQNLVYVSVAWYDKFISQYDKLRRSQAFKFKFTIGNSEINLCSFHLFWCKVHTTRVDKLYNKRTSSSEHLHINVLSTWRGEAPLACQNELIDRFADVLFNWGLGLSFTINQPRRLTQLTTVLVVTAIC